MSYVVLDESLCRTFFNFIQKKHCDINILSKLFQKIHPFFVTHDQLLACGIPLPALQSMSSTSFPWTIYSPEHKHDQQFSSELIKEMVAASKLKLQIVQTPTSHPFKTICIDGQSCDQLVFSSTYKINESRQSAIQHINDLVSSATQSISIHDKFLSIDTADNFDKIFSGLKDNVNINLYAHEQSSSDKHSQLRVSLKRIPELASEKRQGKLKVRPYLHCHHDRYILIDNAIEIVLSSGFYYLFNTDKDFTYLIRIIE